MEKQIDILRKTRSFLMEFTGGLSTEQLNRIPAGFNNNIAWNIAHLVASQQGVCYTRAGLPMIIEQSFFESYKPGTKPEAIPDASQFDQIKNLLHTSIDQFEKDYNSSIFNNYIPWTNRYGVEISNIEEAVAFLIYHEGLHLGYVMALKRLVS